ncbi:MAG: Na-translocating system protein MpsC family protein [Solirubrobacteraceae bacterium]
MHVEANRLNGGQLDSALAHAIARIQSEHLELAPAHATAFHHGNVVVVVMDGVLTNAEKLLVQNGSHGDVG